MNDPYSVLGIGRDATNDEVKQAYKEMMRKYHPDNYTGNPLEDLAADKAKEINEAYDQIMAQRKASGNNAGSGSSQANSQFADIRRMISAGKIIEAEEILNGMPDYKRSAEWYFLKGTIFYQRGWLSEAMRFYRTASEMEPNNYEYKNTYNRMNSQQNGQYNGNPYGGYNTSRNVGSGCDCCCQLICADMCCECMGGDLIPCC